MLWGRPGLSFGSALFLSICSNTVCGSRPIDTHAQHRHKSNASMLQAVLMGAAMCDDDTLSLDAHTLLLDRCLNAN